MRTYLLMLMLLAAVLAGGCTGAATTTASDPIAGNWLYRTSYNDTTIDTVLVFDDSGYFNGYFLGSLTLSGHWSKVNATAYDVTYDNKTRLFILNADKTQIWDAQAPGMAFGKQ